MDLFNLDNIGFANLQIEGFDPISFSLLGMCIVFSGLVVISLYIFYLPILLELPTKLRRKKRIDSHESEVGVDEVDVKTSTEKEKEIMVAIAAAFHLHEDFPEENMKITWLSHGVDNPAWLAAGIVNGLSRRHNLHTTRRQF